MADNSSLQDGLAEIELEMRRMVAGEAAPYECGWNIWGKAMSLAITSPDVMYPLWLIWGALTDWVENRPEERPEAEREMVRAAQEWFALSGESREKRKQYLDRWVFEEMGYERVSGL